MHTYIHTYIHTQTNIYSIFFQISPLLRVYDSEEKTFEYDKSERRIKVKQIVHSPIHTSSPQSPALQSQSPAPPSQSQQSQSAKNIDWRDLKGSGSVLHNNLQHQQQQHHTYIHGYITKSQNSKVENFHSHQLPKAPGYAQSDHM